jgi:cryptochrome
MEYLFEPWKAPLNIQEDASCIIGKDYPLPCIDHERASRENNKKMRNFFSSILNEEFENFLKKKLKPSNVEEYKAFIFASIFSKSNTD